MTVKDRATLPTVDGAGPEALAADIALASLAEELFDRMESIDPDGSTWNGLSDEDRNYYRKCVEWLFMRPDLVRVVLEGVCRLPLDKLERP